MTRIEEGRPYTGTTQVVTLRVCEQWFGEPADEVRLFSDGPPYERGETHFLLLIPSVEEGMYSVIGPDFRWRCATASCTR